MNSKRVRILGVNIGHGKDEFENPHYLGECWRLYHPTSSILHKLL